MKITITNRLAVLIRERQMSSASEFGRRMTAAGYPMSSSHSSRYEKDGAPAFDLKFINVACNVLQCLPNELYGLTVELEPGEEIDPLVVLPRHAYVLRGESHVKSRDAASPSSTATLPSISMPPAAATSKPKAPGKTGTKPVVHTDDDAGPSGSVFPFLKS